MRIYLNEQLNNSKAWVFDEESPTHEQELWEVWDRNFNGGYSGVDNICKALNITRKDITKAYLDDNMTFDFCGLRPYVFEDCVNLKSIELPNNIVYISSYAFKGCFSLEHVGLGNINFIDSNAFNSCKSLKEILIPDTCNTIGFNAFANCKSLEKVVIGDCSTLYLNEQVFYNCPKVKVYSTSMYVINYCKEHKIPYVYLD